MSTAVIGQLLDGTVEADWFSARGYDLTFKGPKDDSTQLSKYGEAQYDHLILYTPTANSKLHATPESTNDAELIVQPSQSISPQKPSSMRNSQVSIHCTSYPHHFPRPLERHCENMTSSSQRQVLSSSIPSHTPLHRLLRMYCLPLLLAWSPTVLFYPTPLFLADLSSIHQAPSTP